MRTEFIVAALLATSAVAPAAAQAPAEPYFTATVDESRALAMELTGLGLTLAGTFKPPFDPELAERFEAMAGPLWQHYGGTLEEADDDLADALRDKLEEIAEEAEEGEEVAALATEAQALLKQAYETVIPAATRAEPAFQGALLIDLLLVDGGVAEGIEEGIENVWEYPGGWAALQRVDALWAGIAPLADAEHKRDAEEMLAQLKALYPGAEPPASMAGMNPEEAEAPAQRLGGIVEAVTHADLYPGRDLPRLAGHLATVTLAACPHYAAGENDVAAESVAAVAALYARHLGATVNMFAQEENERAESLLAALVTVGGDDDDDDDAPATQADDAPAAMPAGPLAGTCNSLGETLTGISGLLGG